MAPTTLVEHPVFHGGGAMQGRQEGRRSTSVQSQHQMGQGLGQGVTEPETERGFPLVMGLPILLAGAGLMGIGGMIGINHSQKAKA